MSGTDQTIGGNATSGSLGLTGFPSPAPLGAAPSTGLPAGSSSLAPGSLVAHPTLAQLATLAALPDDWRDAVLAHVGATLTTPVEVVAELDDSSSRFPPAPTN